MAHLDRFERDFVRNLCWNTIHCLVLLTLFPFVSLFVSAFIFGFPTQSFVKEMLPYNFGFSVAIATVTTLAAELLDLRRQVEQLKLVNSTQSG